MASQIKIQSKFGAHVQTPFRVKETNISAQPSQPDNTMLAIQVEAMPPFYGADASSTDPLLWPDLTETESRALVTSMLGILDAEEFTWPTPMSSGWGYYKTLRYTLGVTSRQIEGEAVQTLQSFQYARQIYNRIFTSAVHNIAWDWYNKVYRVTKYRVRKDSRANQRLTWDYSGFYGNRETPTPASGTVAAQFAGGICQSSLLADVPGWDMNADYVRIEPINHHIPDSELYWSELTIILIY